MEIATVVVQGLGAIAWPAVVGFVLWVFRAPLGTLLTSGSVTVKGPGGLEISTAARAEAASALQTAAADKQAPIAPEAARARVDAGAAAMAGRSTPPRILWVDDRPSNNVHERDALTRLGMVVEESTATADAVNRIMRSAPFDVIVSDMARGDDPAAGYALLDTLRAAGVRTPFVVYSGSADPAHNDQAVAHGAEGSTDAPARLLDLIVGALRREG